MKDFALVSKLPKSAVRDSLGVYHTANCNYEFGVDYKGRMGYYRYKRINYLHYE